MDRQVVAGPGFSVLDGLGRTVPRGISAATRCSNCSHCHTEQARVPGGTEDGIEEAVYFVSPPRRWACGFDRLPTRPRWVQGEDRSGLHGRAWHAGVQKDVGLGKGKNACGRCKEVFDNWLFLLPRGPRIRCQVGWPQCS